MSKLALVLSELIRSEKISENQESKYIDSLKNGKYLSLSKGSPQMLKLTLSGKVLLRSVTSVSGNDLSIEDKGVLLNIFGNSTATPTVENFSVFSKLVNRGYIYQISKGRFCAHTTSGKGKDVASKLIKYAKRRIK